MYPSTQLLIDGKWGPAASGRTIPVLNPATEEQIGTVAHAGTEDLDRALGVPLLALFGPTNPVRTGPVFASPTRLLQPPACPPTGGGNLAELTPETVAAAVSEILAHK